MYLKCTGSIHASKRHPANNGASSSDKQVEGENTGNSFLIHTKKGLDRGGEGRREEGVVMCDPDLLLNAIQFPFDLNLQQ